MYRLHKLYPALDEICCADGPKRPGVYKVRSQSKALPDLGGRRDRPFWAFIVELDLPEHESA
jgi:hypothetical protein